MNKKKETNISAVARNAKKLQRMMVAMLLFCCSIVTAQAEVTTVNDASTLAQRANTTTRKVTGTVVDEQGEPLIGATVKMKDNKGTVGTITDFNGAFTLNVPASAVTLEVSYVGYATRSIKVEAGKNKLSVTLMPNGNDLDEIVVVGYGTQRKETVTGAISMLQTKELTQSPQANVSNMLAGRLPGLLAVQRSGEPGADASTLRIRGVATFAGDSAADPLVLVDGIEISDFNNIDPNEIESMAILKDASSTAVYGVRGANGVIIITTKRGLTGKPQLSYSGNVAITSFTDLRQTLRSYEYATLYNEAAKYDSYLSGSFTPKFSDEALEHYRTGDDPIFFPDVDWNALMLKDYSMTTQHNVNVSGGADKVKYFTSIGYYAQDGMFKATKLIDGFNPQSSYQRFNFRSNIDFEANKYLSFKINIASQMETRKGAGNEGSTTGMMNSIAIANPTETPGIVDGRIVSLGATKNNPLQHFYEGGYRSDYRNHLTTSVGFLFKVPGVKGLSFKGTVSYENYYQHNQKYAKNPFVKYFIRRNDAGELVFSASANEDVYSTSESFSRNRRVYLEGGVNYDFAIAKDHKFTTLLLYNQSKRHAPGLKYHVPNAYQGVVGRLTYDYKHRYMFEFNMGYNGTENFAEGRRFGFFPAYSAGWTVSEEPFFPKNQVVTYFKIRGSYGEVGNDKIGGERFLYLPTTYNGDYGYHLGDITTNGTNQSTVSEGAIGNPFVTWERAKKANVGVELTFWDNHIRVTADYFTEHRNNILANRQTTPILFGGTPSAQNLGKMKNGGFDGDIALHHNIKKFNYWIKANYTYAHNEIEYMDEVTNQYLYKMKTGQILGQHFGLICDGIYNTWEEVNSPTRPTSSWNNDRIQPGDLIYRDINGDGIVNTDDIVPIGYANFPEITYGLSFGGDWKGIDFSVLFQGATHVSLTMSRLYQRGFGEDWSAYDQLRESWSQERYEQGLPITFPHLSVGDAIQKHNYQSSSFWTRDASYLRLKNVEIGYTLPRKWTNLLHISSTRVYVNGSNLLTWTKLPKGIDPESAEQPANNETYPVTRIFNFGLNIKF